ncbi:MAG: hypothetical protein K6B74_02900 [Ruminococcus sp.]|nr:hypothetical protein [Ruminococcus sp.]
MRYDSDIEMNNDLYSFLDDGPREATDKKMFKAVSCALLICLIIGAALWWFDMALSLSTIGIMIAVYGILDLRILKKDAYPEEKYGSAAIIFAGLAFTSVLLTIGLGVQLFGLSNITVIAFVEGAVSLIVLGIIAAAYPFLHIKMKNSRCTRTVTAVCSEVERHGFGRSIYYEHIWKYPYGKISVTASDKIRTSSLKPLVDTHTEIAVNPDDPNDIYRKTLLPKMHFVVIGAALMFTGGMFLLMTFGGLG